MGKPKEHRETIAGIKPLSDCEQNRIGSWFGTLLNYLVDQWNDYHPRIVIRRCRFVSDRLAQVVIVDWSHVTPRWTPYDWSLPKYRVGVIGRE
jgi:hypothetical protein